MAPVLSCGMYSDRDYESVEALLNNLKLVAESIGFNPFDNYRFREMGTLKAVQSIVPDIEPVTGREGEDATSKDYKVIELKSYVMPGKLSDATVCGEFDIRQFLNRDLKVLTIDDYDMFAFGMFRKHELYPHKTIIVRDPESVVALKALVNDKALATIKVMNETKVSVRNSLKIQFRDILTLKTVELVSLEDGKFSTVEIVCPHGGMVDTLALGASVFGRGGSSPSAGTKMGG